MHRHPQECLTKIEIEMESERKEIKLELKTFYSHCFLLSGVSLSDNPKGPKPNACWLLAAGCRLPAAALWAEVHVYISN